MRHSTKRPPLDPDSFRLGRGLSRRGFLCLSALAGSGMALSSPAATIAPPGLLPEPGRAIHWPPPVVPKDLWYEPDVVVIGSGAGGGVVARVLARKWRVLVLEMGPWFDPATYTHKPHIFSNLLAVETTSGVFRPMMVSGVGGTTLHYQGEAHRFAPADLARIPGLGSNPDAVYGEVEKLVGVRTHPPNPASRGLDLPDFVACPLAIDDSCHYCLHCMYGCDIDAKRSTDVLLREAGVPVATGCAVHSTDGTVVNFFREGKRLKVKARAVVLSGGTLGTPAILQRSGVACGDWLQGTLGVQAETTRESHTGVDIDRSLFEKDYSVALHHHDGHVWLLATGERETGPDHRAKVSRTTGYLQIDAPLTDRDRATCKRLREICRGIAAQAGLKLGKIYSADDPFPTDSIMTGTTSRIVDSSFRIAPGVFVADGSVLTNQGGGRSASLTIQAVAMRVAAHVNAELERSHG